MLPPLLRAIAPGIWRAFSLNRSNIAKQIGARMFRTTAMQMAPTRYDDPDIVARRCLLENRLDKHGFNSWQDVLNYFAKKGDRASVEACLHLSIRDKEIVSIPEFTASNDDVAGIYHVGDFSMLPPGAWDRAANRYKTAINCLATKELDLEYFHKWDDLIDFFYTMDDSRLMSAAIGIKHGYIRMSEAAAKKWQPYSDGYVPPDHGDLANPLS